MTHSQKSEPEEELLPHLAVVGMSCRFPGAPDLDCFWQNLTHGVESIVPISDDQLRNAGLDEDLIHHPNYVKVAAALADIAGFDAHFFGFTPREAEITDPQQRLLLEICQETLEHAGYDPNQYEGKIGVFIGTAISTYLVNNIMPNPQLFKEMGQLQVMFGNSSAYHATMVSYKLNLTGPSVNLDTACSTSLVAVHLACKNLLSYECDMALAGGVRIGVPQHQGYIYQQGGIRSPDGHVRAFDARGEGIVAGNGGGMVLLKRLEDAEADGDHIHALVLATAVNNDGNDKVGYSAPSVQGQTNVIADAHALADIDVETITYQEAHGTGTILGDPIEVAALSAAFSLQTSARGFCALGSLKTNVGHMDTAAGIGGFIKTVLCLERAQLVPSLNFETPNPELNLEPGPGLAQKGPSSPGSPFYVNDRLRDWNTVNFPRRAGVSSFGMGGTNAHVILEQAPQRRISGPARDHQLLLLSAKCIPALNQGLVNLRTHLSSHPEENLADIAFTLASGRGNYSHKYFIVAHSNADAIAACDTPGRISLASLSDQAGRSLVFMFPGQGSQYVSMGRDLYESEPNFKHHLDTVCAALDPHLECKLTDLLFPSQQQADKDDLLNQTQYTQPALFAVQYALAQLLIGWGIRPAAMIGHSVGEFAAATLAGVFSLEDAALLVARRGSLMASCHEGAMMAVQAGLDDIAAYLSDQVALAAVNEPGSVTLSGDRETIERLAKTLKLENIECRLLKTSHAFHGPTMDNIIDSFRTVMQNITLHPPQLQLWGCAAPEPIPGEEMTKGEYWVRQIRQPVYFSACLQRLMGQHQVFLEVGPAQVLSNFTRRHGFHQDIISIACMRQERETVHDQARLLFALGRLWQAGIVPDWKAFFKGQRRNHVALPTYSFQRKTYWIDAPKDNQKTTQAKIKNADIGNWFYVPTWKTSLPIIRESDLEAATWLIFTHNSGTAQAIARQLGPDHDLVFVHPTQRFSYDNLNNYEIDPSQADHYQLLLENLAGQGRLPKKLVHMWQLDDAEDESLHLEQNLGFYSLVYLCRSMAELGITDVLPMAVVSNKLQSVLTTDICRPSRATILGPCAVIPQEYSNITCVAVDLDGHDSDDQARAILEEFRRGMSDHLVAYRHGSRFVRAYEPLPLASPEKSPRRLRHGGVYAVIGGMGDIGRKLSHYLVDQVAGKLLILTHTPLPPEANWDALLAQEPESPMAQRINHIRALHAKGAQVMLIALDVADAKALQAAFVSAEERFGSVHGVFHAASAQNLNFGLISALSREDCANQFRAKVDGLLSLAEALEDRPMDFTLLFSSLATELGGIGYSAYAAANHFMDAFVLNNQKASAHWQTVNWDAWNFPRQGKGKLGASLVDLAIQPDEGMDALGRILDAAHIPRIVNSTGDLQQRLNQWIALESLNQSTTAVHHDRPNLSTPYVAPSDDIQQMLVDMWQALFGMRQVGIHDNFFELGGNSLMGTQVTSRIRDAFGVGLSIQLLFDAPTISDIAHAIESASLAETDSETLAGLLAEIEEIPDDQATSLLEPRGDYTL